MLIACANKTEQLDQGMYFEARSRPVLSSSRQRSNRPAEPLFDKELLFISQTAKHRTYRVDEFPFRASMVIGTSFEVSCDADLLFPMPLHQVDPWRARWVECR